MAIIATIVKFLLKINLADLKITMVMLQLQIKLRNLKKCKNIVNNNNNNSIIVIIMIMKAIATNTTIKVF